MENEIKMFQILSFNHMHFSFAYIHLDFDMIMEIRSHFHCIHAKYVYSIKHMKNCQMIHISELCIKSRGQIAFYRFISYSKYNDSFMTTMKHENFLKILIQWIYLLWGKTIVKKGELTHGIFRNIKHIKTARYTLFAVFLY